MTTSPVLGLTLMSASQAQKETVYNEFLIAMDSLFRGSVLSAALSAPPSSPSPGDAYIVNVSATGAWSGYDNQIAFYYNGWQFVSPPLKIRMYDVAASEFYEFEGGALTGGTFRWTAQPASTVTVLDDLTNVAGTPTNGQVLTYNTGASKWEPATPSFTGALSALSDVEVTEGSAINGNYLAWNNSATKWEPSAPPTSASFHFLGLSDVSLTGVANGDILVYTTTGPGVKFVAPTAITSVPSLSNVGDVSYTGLAEGDVLQWNGAAWAPSSAYSPTLSSLLDVSVTEGSGINGYVLTYNSTSGKWVADPPPAGATLHSLSDVSVTEGSGINGYLLAWNNVASAWEAVAPSTVGVTELSALSDVSVSEGSGINGDVLYWNNGASKWEAKALAAVAASGAYSDLSGAPSIPTTLSALTDVSVTEGSGINGYTLNWNNSAGKWEAVAPVSAGPTALSGLSDVSVTEGSGINGYLLAWNNGAGKWEAVSPGSVGGTYVSSGTGFLFNGSSDTNWETGIDLGSFTLSHTGSATTLMVVTGGGTSGPDGFAIGTTGAASTFEVVGHTQTAYVTGTGGLQIDHALTLASGVTLTGLNLSMLDDVNVSEGSGINGYTLNWNAATSKWVATAPVSAGSTTLAGLSDVNVTEGSAINGYALTWSNSTSKWVASALPSAGSTTLHGLSDVSVTEGSGINGYLLSWNNGASAWQAVAPSTVGVTTLSALSDVNVTEGSSINGYTLNWNNSTGKWVATAPVSGGVSTLAALSDVNVSEGSGINGYTLNWNNSTSKWVATAPITPGSTTLAGDTDVSISSPANNQQLLYQTGSSKWTNENVPVAISTSITGTMSASEIVLQYVVPVAFTIPSGASGSYAKANNAATGSSTVTINKNGTSIGTIAWAASGTSGTFTFSTATSFAAGDIIQLVAPGTADATLANIGITLAGYRS